MISQFRRNSRLLLTLVAAWSILLGAGHALHAVYHLTLTGTVSTAADHSCTLCTLDREPLLPTVEAAEASSSPEPALLPLPGLLAAHAAVSLPLRDVLSPCAGRAPPSFSVS
jgi:hypothetical protein